MTDATKILMSSRRTIMSGEVVTFATGFTNGTSAFGDSYSATGPFEVSASRDAVVVHRADCCDNESVEALISAVRLAGEARIQLNLTWRGGADSMYPRQPTPCGAK